MPTVDAIAARGKDGLVHLALVNLDPHRKARVRAALAGFSPHGADGWVLTATNMDAHNTFDHPDAVRRKLYRLVWGDEAVFDVPAKIRDRGNAPLIEARKCAKHNGGHMERAGAAESSFAGSRGNSVFAAR